MCRAGLTGGWLDPLWEKWSVSITDHFWPFFLKWVRGGRRAARPHGGLDGGGGGGGGGVCVFFFFFK